MEQLGLEVRNSVRRKGTSLHNLIQQSKVLSTGDKERNILALTTLAPIERIIEIPHDNL